MSLSKRAPKVCGGASSHRPSQFLLFNLATAILSVPTALLAQGFPNVPRTAGELLAGPVAPEQGRTAIIAWHGERIVSVPEIPGSQGGADWQMRVVDINDPANPVVTLLPAHASGFHAHGYFHSGPYLYVGPHCLTSANLPCGSGGPDLWRDSLRIGGSGTAIGSSQLRRASMEGDNGLPIGGVDKSGAQSPWGVRDFWTYNAVSGPTFLAVRRSLASWIYDWPNGGAPTGPAIMSSWDHLSQTGVIGFPFIMGNILIFASDQSGTGVAAYDISNPAAPVLLDVLKDENPGGYWPEVYGHYIFFPRRDGEGGTGSSAGFMVVDFSDPTNLTVVADRNLPGSNQYVTFQDEYAFMNRYKIDMRTFEPVLTLATVPGVIDASQFALPVGNLLVTGGYGTDGPGLAIWAHQAAADNRSPFVAYHVPRPDQTNYSIHCPITLSIPETLRTETIIDGVSLIVRPVGGSPIPIWHSFGQGKLLTVTPRSLLSPNTTYEVVLTDGILDAAGNPMEPYSFRFSTGSGLSGGNQPPVVNAITAVPGVGTPAVPVDLSWSGSDPDGAFIEFRVDFGDGTPKTAWGAPTTANHAYAQAGHYQVTVQARDAAGSVAARSRTVTVATAPSEPNSTASSPVVVDSAAGRAYAVNPDVDTVSAVHTGTLAKVWESPVAGHPKSIATANDGTVWVACRDGDAIDILDGATGAFVQRLPLGHGRAPVGIAPVPGGGTMLVACDGDGTLRRFSVATRSQTGSLALGPSPRAIAVNQAGTRALVTRFISGEHSGSLYDVALGGSMSLTRTINLARDRSADGSASSRGVPNYLSGVRISPDGQWAWVVGKKDNTTRGSFFSPLNVPGQDNTVRAQLMLVDLVANAEDLTRRLDIDNSDSPTSVAFSPLGDYAFIALQGNAQVAVVDVLDFMRQDSPGTVKTRLGAGISPQGVAFDAGATRLFANNFMGRSMTAISLSEFLDSGSGSVPSQTVPLVSEERLHPSVLLGKRIFYHASDPRMSAEGYISCATCHVDGGHDGRTFDFTNRGEGFRNTGDLRGRSGTGHGAVHWSANFDEIQDFEIDMRDAFGGSGFIPNGQYVSIAAPLGAPKAGASADLDALAAYVTSLGSASIPRSPHRNADGSLTASALVGQALFNAHGCAACHNPATEYTDRTRHNVGTLRASSGNRLGGVLDGIDTPTLLGLHATAPYFHDGSAATLAEVFTVTGGRMEQAENGTLANGAFADTVTWHPYKEWHGGAFVELDGSGTVTFTDVASSVAGPGFVEVRYNSGYGASQLRLIVNGTTINTTVPITPNEPMWLPNEWRTVRIPVTYQAGMNTIVFREGNTFASLKVDDMVFSTPGDRALASAHVRGFTVQETSDISAYLNSLDGTNALHPLVSVSRGTMIPQGGTDSVTVPTGAVDHTLAYTLANPGAGPLNLGQFRVDVTPSGAAWIEAHPAANVPAGGQTTLNLRFQTPPVPCTATVRGWSDVAGIGEVQFTVQATVGGGSGIGEFMDYE